MRSSWYQKIRNYAAISLVSLIGCFEPQNTAQLFRADISSHANVQNIFGFEDLPYPVKTAKGIEWLSTDLYDSHLEGNFPYSDQPNFYEIKITDREGYWRYISRNYGKTLSEVEFTRPGHQTIIFDGSSVVGKKMLELHNPRYIAIRDKFNPSFDNVNN